MDILNDRDKKQLLIRRFFLVIYDVCAVVAASLLALLVRFDLSYSKIELKYIDIIEKDLPAMVLITIVVFFFCRLYSSLWKYAGAMEAVNITAGALISSFCNILYIIAANRDIYVPLPRSFYLIYSLFMLLFTFA